MNRAGKVYLSAVLAMSITFLAAYQGYTETKTVMSQGIVNTKQQIVLDAGHGGEDGGAVGDDGTKESDINLAIVQKLYPMLSFMGYDVILTRDSDQSIHDPSADTVRQQKISDLKNRLEIVNNHPDCIFLSIHQNKFSQSKYKGAQVFYSTNNENSIVYAQSVQDSIAKLIQTDNTRQIKNIGDTSYIMRNSNVPSVLVECGFVSNPQELENLKNMEYQSKLAFAVMCGMMAADAQLNG